ncbi:MAG: signal peptidase II [Candidatus Aminicenantes bacterium]|nr:signal peptidase II [Candidatus Aminicenantes bacterium]
MKRNSPYLFFVLALVALDQATKLFVSRAVERSVTVIPGFFDITLVHNKGAIFGAFSRSDSRLVFWALTLASLTALGLVVAYFLKTPPSDRLLKIALSLILAGALGNLIDRVLRGHVIDFLDLYIGNAHWPVFNAADSCITIGAFLILLIFFRRKPACTPSS